MWTRTDHRRRRVCAMALAAGLWVSSGEAADSSDDDLPLLRPTVGILAGYGWPTDWHGRDNFHGAGVGATLGLTVAFTRSARSPGVWVGVDLVNHLGTRTRREIRGEPIEQKRSAAYYAGGLGFEFFIAFILVRPTVMVGWQDQYSRCISGPCESRSGSLTYASYGVFVGAELPLSHLQPLRALRIGCDLRMISSSSALWGYGAPPFDTSGPALYLATEAAF
jgi:hypothetical protein